jgi:hypothetical protein
MGASGGVVVKALRNKPAGRGLDSSSLSAAVAKGCVVRSLVNVRIFCVMHAPLHAEYTDGGLYISRGNE